MFESDSRPLHLTLLLVFQLLLPGAGLSLFVAGCEKNDASAVEEATTLSVKPSSTTLVKGDSVQMKITPRDFRGNTVPGYEVTWAIKDDTAATVDTSGTVLAQNVGSTSITATAEKEGAESLSGRSKITVVHPQTGSLRVSVSMSGDDLDSDGDSVVVDESTSKDIGPNESATFSGLSEGDHSVELSGLQFNCATDASTTKTVSDSSKGIASASFSIICPSTDNSDLTVHPTNPHYLQDGSETVILIGGGKTVHPSSDGQLTIDENNIDEWTSFGVNFARIWTILPWEGTDTVYPWARTGPGTANDGGPKFDLTKFDEEYFDRMEELLAHNPDFYLQFMVFDEVGLEPGSERWDRHPFNPDNHINSLRLLSTGSNAVPEFYDTSNRRLMQIQEDYVHKVLGELDHHPNIIYEIANETTAPWDWQRKWVDFIEFRSDSPISNNPFARREKNLEYKLLDIVNYHNLDETNTNSIILSDKFSQKVLKFDEQATSGLDASGMRQVAWQTFTAGAHLNWDAVENQGEAQRTSYYLASFITENDVDPATMWPSNSLVNVGFALANPGTEYVVFLHSARAVTVDLSAAPTSLTAKWYDTATGNYSSPSTIEGGGNFTLTNPFETDVVLYIEK